MHWKTKEEMCDSRYCSGLETNLHYLWGMPVYSRVQSLIIFKLNFQVHSIYLVYFFIILFSRLKMLL